MRSSIILLILIIGLLPLIVAGAIMPNADAGYYVDSTMGSDAYTCVQARNPGTPKQTVGGIMSCPIVPGDIVKFRGVFTQSLLPAISGAVLYPAGDIAQVSGDSVTFNTSLEGIDPSTDWVTVYGSRKGNSGAFAVLSVSDNVITVDTQYLPGGKFLDETFDEPGELQAAVLRPVVYTAWDKDNPPTWNTGHEIPFITQGSVIMLSYLQSVTGAEGVVWPAIQIGGAEVDKAIDYNIIDHMDISNANSGLSTGAEAQANYTIIQHNDFHDIGASPMDADYAVLYWGHWGRPDMHHDYVQIMYNHVGPHMPDVPFGDGIDTKQSAHNFTVFGNEVEGIHSNACGDAPIKTEGIDGFIANNYVHDIYPTNRQGCGIAAADGVFDIWTNTHLIIANNIIANVAGVGMSLVDIGNAEIYNNVVYNITPSSDPSSDPEHNVGIEVWAWQSHPTGNLVYNNIVSSCSNYGISSYYGSAEVISNNNIIYNCAGEAFHDIPQGDHDRVIDPQLVDPANGDFRLSPSSPGIDAGMPLSQIAIDFERVLRPQGLAWDIGAYEYQGAIVPTDTPQPTDTSTAVFTPTRTPRRTPGRTATPTPECIQVTFKDGTTIMVCKP